MIEEPLYVSAEGEFRTWPEDAAEIREPVLSGRPWRWDDAGPHLDVETISWHRVRFSPEAERAVRRLLAERDEAREHVRFLMEFVEEMAITGPLPPPMSTGLQARWGQWHALWRSLRDQPWFRDRKP